MTVTGVLGLVPGAEQCSMNTNYGCSGQPPAPRHPPSAALLTSRVHQKVTEGPKHPQLVSDGAGIQILKRP